MSGLRSTLARLFALLTRRSRSGDADVRAELDFHLAMIEADLRRGGMDTAAARREARLRVGGETQVLEAYADQRSVPVLESTLQDVRYALRTFRRAPTFTAAALLTLAVGIGTTAAVFAAVDAVLLRPLPFADPERLVVIGEGTPADQNATTGYATLADLRDRTRTLQELAIIRSWQTTLVTSEAERLAGLRVSWNYFRTLGVAPALGRTFDASDDHPQRWRVLVLSDGLWRRRFNSDPSVVGRRITMNDLSFEIVGVMPAAFEDLLSTRFYQEAELWAPLGYDSTLSYACRSCRHLKAIGRLHPGATPAQAADDLTGIHRDLVRQYPTQYAEPGIGVFPLRSVVSGPVHDSLLVMMGAVVFVLLIACANVANLLIARGMNRTREIAVRVALGASRQRIVRQLMTESVVLWTAGGAAGLALAAVSIRVLVAAAPVDVPRSESIALDWPVLAAGAALALGTGLLFGLVPAFGAVSGLSRASATGSRGVVSAASRRMRQALVVVDIAVALVLVVAAALLLRSGVNLLRVDPGFSADRVLTAEFALVGERYREDAPVNAFIEQFVERVRTLPGVESAAVSGQVPMGGNRDRFGIHIEGSPTDPGHAPSAERYSVTPDYFRTLGIQLRRGRLLTEADTTTAPAVMLLSETAERVLFPGEDAIGRRIRVGGSPDAPWRTVVGIVADVRHSDLGERAWPQMYLPESQFTDSYLVLSVRSSTNEPSALVPAIRAELRAMDPGLALYGVATLESLVAESLATRRFVTVVLGGFACVALALAAIGLYGVIAYTVAQRTREVGLRMALGASRKHVLQLVFGSGARTVVAGLVLGMAAAAVVTRTLQAQLYNVSPLDPVALAAAVAVMVSVAAAAHLVPVRRALRVEPTVALRED